MAKADKKPKTWMPLQARIKVELLGEHLEERVSAGGIVMPVLNDGKKEVYRRAKVIALGPLVGLEQFGMEPLRADYDIDTKAMKSFYRQQVTKFEIGDELLVNFNTLIQWRDGAGETHFFVKDDSFVVARFE